MTEWLGADQLAQHVIVFLAAVGAAAIVARRVFGVFDRRSTGSGSAPGSPAAPGCSHCAAGTAAQKKHVPR